MPPHSTPLSAMWERENGHTNLPNPAIMQRMAGKVSRNSSAPSTSKTPEGSRESVHRRCERGVKEMHTPIIEFENPVKSGVLERSLLSKRLVVKSQSKRLVKVKRSNAWVQVDFTGLCRMAAIVPC